MKKLVYVDDLVRVLQRDININGANLARVRRHIDAAPAVDAVEVVHGHWCWEGKFKACSNCGSYVERDETLGANFWKFCPYCGAKMDGGADNV